MAQRATGRAIERIQSLAHEPGGCRTRGQAIDLIEGARA